MNATPTLTAAPLWTRARAMFARAIAAIGDAASIARLASLAPTLRRQIVAWLAPLEQIVRKLLLAEAAELKRSQTWSAGPQARNSAVAEKSGAPGGARSNLQTLRSIDPTAPETWPATFSLAPPRDPLAVPDSRAPRIRALWGDTPKKKGDTHASAASQRVLPPPCARVCHPFSDSALRLARRLEALRRVLEDPLPHAQRLARLLVRAVRRFPEIARRYLFAPARTGDYDKEDPRLSLDAMSAAFNAPDMFGDSS